MKRSLLYVAAIALLSACQREEPPPEPEPIAAPEPVAEAAESADAEPAGPELLVDRNRLDIYHPVELTADLSHLSDNQREMLRLLIGAADIMDNLFWRQSFGRPDTLLDSIGDEAIRRFVEVNYGPWDRLGNERAFLSGFDADKPAGARLYPEDMSKAEFEAWDHPEKNNPYSVVRRDGHGNLELVPYHDLFAEELHEAANLLRQAAGLTESTKFSHYLNERALALTTDDYQPSDMAWMDVRDNDVELVIGAIENYEDRLFGTRNAYEAFVLIKDREWSERLDRFAALLPELQRSLPVDDAYKAEKPGTDADLNAYDAIYYSGDANAGSKTIAINLPNDEQVQLEKGTRRLQLKNTMRAKFDHILVPIADLLIAADQREHITFDAFFANVMFHEVSHGLGIKNVIGESDDGGATVREALREHFAALEEGKADILGLHMIQQLHAMDEWEGSLMDHYVTFLAGIFRSVRFGAASAHGRANMAAFNYLLQAQAIAFDSESGTWRVEEEAFEQTVANLSRDILMLQGNGDYAAAGEFLDMFGTTGRQLEQDLADANAAGIPVDIALRQGPEVVGLQSEE